MRGVVTPTSDAQAKYELLGASIAVEGARYRVGTPFLGLPPPLMFGPINIYRKLRAGPLRRAAEAMKWRAERAFELATELRTMQAALDAGVRANVRQAAGRLYSLYFRAEQAPDPDNRVSLSDTRDALGVPHVKLDWRVKPIDVRGITGWLKLLSEDLPSKGLGTVIFPAAGWEHKIVGGPHHMGTTRMSADRHHGVVDEHCRVHTVDNLYMAGSSVFATAGYANPTFPLVTLALRLADTLQARLR
jgi:choline dehydrogenase-like flavoprotein